VDYFSIESSGRVEAKKSQACDCTTCTLRSATIDLSLYFDSPLSGLPPLGAALVPCDGLHCLVRLRESVAIGLKTGISCWLCCRKSAEYGICDGVLLLLTRGRSKLTTCI